MILRILGALNENAHRHCMRGGALPLRRGSRDALLRLREGLALGMALNLKP